LLLWAIFIKAFNCEGNSLGNDEVVKNFVEVLSMVWELKQPVINHLKLGDYDHCSVTIAYASETLLLKK
jgi:hypothetical protein